MKRAVFAIVLLSVFLVPSRAVFGTVDYARQTGKACGVCHFDSMGGGKLTAQGRAFRDELKLKGLYRPLSRTQHIVRFIIGYIHTMTAIIWFGAILYVHLLLKPAYAARGLPKGELILGWACIVTMAVTGTLLSVAKVPSFYALFHTRFGVLLVIKVCLFLVMVTTAAVVTFVIGPKMRKRMLKKITRGAQDLTLEELAQFDGRDGRDAYVAVQGKIYDLSSSKLWKQGAHVRKHLAGGDLTEALKKAPHGPEKLEGFPVVGKLLTSKPQDRPMHQKVFYIFAYLNLILVFLIVFVISLWRWW